MRPYKKPLAFLLNVRFTKFRESDLNQDHHNFPSDHSVLSICFYYYPGTQNTLVQAGPQEPPWSPVSGRYGETLKQVQQEGVSGHKLYSFLLFKDFYPPRVETLQQGAYRDQI